MASPRRAVTPWMETSAVGVEAPLKMLCALEEVWEVKLPLRRKMAEGFSLVSLYKLVGFENEVVSVERDERLTFLVVGSLCLARRGVLLLRSRQGMALQQSIRRSATKVDSI